MLARCRIIAKRIRLFPNLTDLSGRGKSVDLKQTTKQTTRKNTLFAYLGWTRLGITSPEIGKTAVNKLIAFWTVIA